MPLATPQQTREIIANQPKATSEERTARARQSLAFARREAESRTGKNGHPARWARENRQAVTLLPRPFDFNSPNNKG